MTEAASRYGARQIYARLLGYAKPYWRMYLVGVFGMVLFAATDLLISLFIRTYLKNTIVVQPDPRLLTWLPLGVLVIFFCRGVGDYLVGLLSRLGGTTGDPFDPR